MNSLENQRRFQSVPSRALLAIWSTSPPAQKARSPDPRNRTPEHPSFSAFRSRNCFSMCITWSIDKAFRFFGRLRVNVTKLFGDDLETLSSCDLHRYNGFSYLKSPLASPGNVGFVEKCFDMVDIRLVVCDAQFIFTMTLEYGVVTKTQINTIGSPCMTSSQVSDAVTKCLCRGAIFFS